MRSIELQDREAIDTDSCKGKDQATHVELTETLGFHWVEQKIIILPLPLPHSLP